MLRLTLSTENTLCCIHTLKNFLILKLVKHYLIINFINNEQNLNLRRNSAACFHRNVVGTFAMSYPVEYWFSHLRYCTLYSARITVAQQQSLVTLVQGTDTQCYNYSLPYAFATVPEVAVGKFQINAAIHDFESRATSDLFFSIKPTQTDSLVSVPFLIRTHWKYTFWNKIAFSFIAEDRRDFESGYYQIDSGLLGGCDAGKSIQIILPFKRIGQQ